MIHVPHGVVNYAKITVVTLLVKKIALLCAEKSAPIIIAGTRVPLVRVAVNKPPKPVKISTIYKKKTTL